MAKVMLVEDDNNLREIYEARLAAEGYEIVAAQDGEEALALAVKERPDLIIADIMMPKVSGFDMLDILRSTPETKHTKIIMMTALSQAEDKTRAEKLGADRYLVKSQVTLEDVVKVASEMLNDPNGGATGLTDQPVVDPTTNLPVSSQPAEPSSSGSTDDSSADDDATYVKKTELVNEKVEVKEPATADKPDDKTEQLSSITADQAAEVTEQIDDFIKKNPTLTTSADPKVEKDSATQAPTTANTDKPVDATPTFKEEIITGAPKLDEAKATSIPVTVAEEPAQAPATSNNDTGSDADKTMANAVDSLSGSSAQNNTPASEPKPKPAEEDDKPKAAKKGGERVIQPLSDAATTVPDLEALLAKEEGDSGLATPPANAVIAPGGQVTHPAAGAPLTNQPAFTDGTTSPGSVVQAPNADQSSPNPDSVSI